VAPNGSNNITDLGNSLFQKTVTFSVNISLAPSVNAFTVFLTYNTEVFNNPAVDYTGNILEPLGGKLQRLCIDGLAQPGSIGCQLPDALGVISVAVYLLNNLSTPAVTNGLLFHVTFTIAGTGLGQVHLLPDVPGYTSELSAAGLGGTGGHVSFTTQDGYYTNLACPQNTTVACRPPTVLITASPPTTSLGSPATYNATVIDTNANAMVNSYVWDWGDGTPTTPPSSVSLAKHSFILNTFGAGSPCINGGACPVTVIILDSDNVNWRTTIVVPIVHLNIKISVSELNIDHQFNSVPGTQIHISAKVQNRSTLAEKANLTIFLDGKAINSHPFNLNASGSQFGTGGQLSVDWNTTGLAPRAYAITVSVCRQHCLTTDPLSSQSGIVSAQTVGGSLVYGENDTSESSQTSYVILIVPQVLGALSLGLLQTAGLGILIIIAAALGLSRFLKKPSYKVEL
jgi:hypothetical protein